MTILLSKFLYKSKILISAIFCLVLSSFGELNAQFDFPKPKGKYTVGTTYISFLRDKDNYDNFNNSGDKRIMYAKVWYPSLNTGDEKSIYWPKASISDKMLTSMFRIPNGTFGFFEKLETNSFQNVRIANDNKNFPVVLFAHGYSFWVTQNTVLMEHLASHGYIVFSLTFSHESAYQRNKDELVIYEFENPELKKRWAEIFSETSNNLYKERIYESDTDEAWELEKKFLDSQKNMNLSASLWKSDFKHWLDFLEKENKNPSSFFFQRLNFVKIATIGHSFGGSSAVLAAYKDKRVKAAINLDGTQYGFTSDYIINKPLMFIYNSSLGSDINRIYYDNTKSDYFGIEIKNSGHLNFSDLPFFMPMLSSNPKLVGRLPHSKATSLINSLILSFLDEYLDNNNNSYNPVKKNKSFKESLKEHDISTFLNEVYFNNTTNSK